MTKETITQAARATTGEQPATKPKGSRPTHRLTRIVQVNGAKEFQDVGALWAFKSGKGFFLKTKVALSPTDELMVNLIGGAS